MTYSTVSMRLEILVEKATVFSDASMNINGYLVGYLDEKFEDVKDFELRDSDEVCPTVHMTDNFEEYKGRTRGMGGVIFGA